MILIIFSGAGRTVTEFLFGCMNSSDFSTTDFSISVTTYMDFLLGWLALDSSFTLIWPSLVFSIRFSDIYGWRTCCIDRELRGPPWLFVELTLSHLYLEVDEPLSLLLSLASGLRQSRIKELDTLRCLLTFTRICLDFWESSFSAFCRSPAA